MKVTNALNFQLPQDIITFLSTYKKRKHTSILFLTLIPVFSCNAGLFLKQVHRSKGMRLLSWTVSDLARLLHLSLRLIIQGTYQKTIQKVVVTNGLLFMR